MKLTLNLEKKYFFSFLIVGLIILGVVGVVAYNSAGTGGVPSVFGHSADEIEWGPAINSNVTFNGFVNATTLCLSGNCISSWSSVTSTIQTTSGVSKIIPGTGVTISPTTGTGEVTINAIGGSVAGVSSIIAGSGISISPASGAGAVTINANAAADTRCDVAGRCTQVCIGGDCRSSWPTTTTTTTGVTSINGATGAVTLVAGSGISITRSGTSITIAATGTGTASASCVYSGKTYASGAICSTGGSGCYTVSGKTPSLKCSSGTWLSSLEVACPPVCGV